MAKNCRIQGYMQDKSSKMKISIYTWKLAETRQFKQLQNTALQAPIDGANIWTATWLYNIVQLLGSSILDHRNSRLDPRILRLNPRISKLEAFEPWDARIKLRVSRFKCQFTFQQYCKYNSVYTWLKKHCRLRSIHHRQWGFKDLWVYMLTSKANSFITSLHCHELLVWMQIPGVLCLRHTIVFLCSLPRKLLGPILCFQVCVSDIAIL